MVTPHKDQVGESFGCMDIKIERKNISILGIVFSTKQSESGRLKMFYFSIFQFAWKPEQEAKLTKMKHISSYQKRLKIYKNMRETLIISSDLGFILNILSSKFYIIHQLAILIYVLLHRYQQPSSKKKSNKYRQYR